jgi:molybdopterin synthase sulfur carrier subunit
MKVLYFAWLRDKTGLAEEEIQLPGEVTTVGALVDWLKARSDGHADAFADTKVVRAAVNQEFADPADPVAEGDEVAFFPPMTGG